MGGPDCLNCMYHYYKSTAQHCLYFFSKPHVCINFKRKPYTQVRTQDKIGYINGVKIHESR
jgi:hypothetical protein